MLAAAVGAVALSLYALISSNDDDENYHYANVISALKYARGTELDLEILNRFRTECDPTPFWRLWEHQPSNSRKKILQKIDNAIGIRTAIVAGDIGTLQHYNDAYSFQQDKFRACVVDSLRRSDISIEIIENALRNTPNIESLDLNRIANLIIELRRRQLPEPEPEPVVQPVVQPKAKPAKSPKQKPQKKLAEQPKPKPKAPPAAKPKPKEEPVAAPKREPMVAHKNEPAEKPTNKTVVKMHKQSGVFFVPCRINGTMMQFIFDTGASDVSMSLNEVRGLYDRGTLTDRDFLGTQRYQVADGSIAEGTLVNLRSVEIGNRMLHNVQASIVHSKDAPMLLGQSALARFGKISIDYQKEEITFE
ncbi:hypothetical protein AGMMS49965_17680 [Bacteroidia bacterium]|nr:hypothetical protein AGMMS49965_17680 [Bacteroidia bacterium]